MTLHREARGLFQVTEDVELVQAYTGVTVVAGGTAHTKGSWVEAIASTNEEYAGLMLCDLLTTHATSGADTNCLMDIGFGASGSEVVVVADIAAGAAQQMTDMIFPIRVPKGTRVSLRQQSATAAKSNAGWYVLPIPDLGYQETFDVCATYGADTATSDGFVMTGVGATGVEGPWTQLTASTTDAIRAIVMTLGGPGATSSWIANTSYVDLAVGASGSEVSVLDGLRVVSSASEERRPSCCPVVPLDIPAGSRLSMRYYSVSTTSAGGKPRPILHAFR